MSMTFLDSRSSAKIATKKLPASRYSVTGDIDADPSSPNYQYSEYPKPELVLTWCWLGDTLVNDEGILIFEIWCLN